MLAERFVLASSSVRYSFSAVLCALHLPFPLLLVSLCKRAALESLRNASYTFCTGPLRCWKVYRGSDERQTTVLNAEVPYTAGTAAACQYF